MKSINLDQLTGIVDVRLFCSAHLETDKSVVAEVETKNVPAELGTWHKNQWCNFDKMCVVLGIWGRDPHIKSSLSPGAFKTAIGERYSRVSQNVDTKK